MILVAVIAIAVIVGSFLLRPGSDSDETSSARDRASTPSASPTAEETPRKRKKARADRAQGRPAGGAPDDSAFGVPPGIVGTGRVDSLPAHRLTITMSSSTAPLGLIAYIIPTSQKHSRGKVTVQGSSWSLTTTVYGNPKYATAFAQAGYQGNPVTCTITVDGKVTERRSTRGAYGTMWCLG